MKLNLLIVLFFMSAIISCNSENRVIEESYPDGSPKRVCIYRGKGENRELIKETTFYPNKQMQMEGTYKDGKRDGKWMYWYENGKVWSDGFFIRGKSDGKRTTYFENGKVRYEGFYKEDMRVGKWSFFDEQGRLLQEVDYSAQPKDIKK